MLISCPKCNAVYMVSENQIPKDGKRFKCAECGNVWNVKPEDFKNLEPEKQVKSQIIRPAAAYDADDSDLENMFNRVSQDTKGLFSGNGSSDGFFKKTLRKIQVIFSPTMLNCTILLFIFSGIFYIGYKNRYEIAGLVPRLENFYKNLGLDYIYKGRNLVFKDVSVKHIERQGKHYVEVSGLIYNSGRLKSQILPVKAVMSHYDGTVAAEKTIIPPVDKLDGDFSSVFRIILPNKTTDAKKLTLLFDETALPKNEVKKAVKKEVKKKSTFDFGFNRGMENF